MSILNKSTWELAEAHLSGSLTESELAELNSKLELDAAFSAEFY